MSWPGVARGAADRWPASFAPVGFVLAFGGALFAGVLVAGVAAAFGADLDGRTPGLTIAGTVLQDAIFIATAALLAASVGHIGPRDFGLVSAPWKRAVGWAIAGIVGFYVFSLVYVALVEPSGEQDTLETLGADRGLALLIASAALVIVVAPFAEEIFFRGFFYRALRNRFSVWGSAAIVGAVFGSIHYSGPETLSLLPVLAVLGVVFCLLYERTGSLYPAIAVHAVNNTIAFAAGSDAAQAPLVAAIAGVLALAACAPGVARRDPATL